MFSVRQQKFSSDTPLDAVTIIGLQTVIRGESLHVEQDLRIDGRIEADVTADGRLVIGPNGSVHGSVTAREMVVGGQVIGSIRVEGCLTVQATAVVHGSLAASRLAIEEGASGSFQITIGSHPPPVRPPEPSLAIDQTSPHAGDGAVEPEVDMLAVSSSEPPLPVNVAASERSRTSSGGPAPQRVPAKNGTTASAENVRSERPAPGARRKSGGKTGHEGSDTPANVDGADVESTPIERDRFW